MNHSELFELPGWANPWHDLYKWLQQFPFGSASARVWLFKQLLPPISSMSEFAAGMLCAPSGSATRQAAVQIATTTPAESEQLN